VTAVASRGAPALAYDARVNDLGVVDPLRLPSPIERLIRDLPPIGMLFVALAVVDVIGRTIGFVTPRVDFAHGDGVSILSSYLPHDLLILLPAIVVARRRAADRETPWIFRGAILAALVELLWRPTASLVAGGISPDDVTPVVSLSVVHAALVAGGWVFLGWGLTALNPPEPLPFSVGLANLVAGLIVLAMGVSIVSLWLLAIGPTSNALPDLLSLVGPVASMLGLLAWAYVARTVARGLGDRNRPSRATMLGTVAVALSALATLAIAILGVIGAWNPGGIASSGLLSTSFTIAFVGEPVALSLLVIAFALGLADPSRPVVSAWDAAQATQASQPGTAT